MSSPQPRSAFAAFTVDSTQLSGSAINAVRTMLGVIGAISLVIGLLVVFWPERTAQVFTILLGIYFVIAGIAYAGIGVFSKGISGGARALNLVLGVLFLVGGVVTLMNVSATLVVLAGLFGILVGIIWILEGVLTLAQVGDASSKGWAIFFGILSIIAGIVVLFAPVWGAAVLFLVLGISLAILGVVQIVRAFTFGRRQTA